MQTANAGPGGSDGSFRASDSGGRDEDGGSERPLRCEMCGTPHDGSQGSARFCSLTCARRKGGHATRKKRELEYLALMRQYSEHTRLQAAKQAQQVPHSCSASRESGEPDASDSNEPKKSRARKRHTTSRPDYERGQVSVPDQIELRQSRKKSKMSEANGDSGGSPP
mmetsp:Transcript_6331/g.16892  ORF Transcript_6331/g.16892 Transcript_6331/m.16892 type:complete len:167 (+) Transcript_6331:233-733(+)